QLAVIAPLRPVTDGRTMIDADTLNLLREPAAATPAWSVALARLYSIADDLDDRDSRDGSIPPTNDHVLLFATPAGYAEIVDADLMTEADRRALFYAALQVWSAAAAMRTDDELSTDDDASALFAGQSGAGASPRQHSDSTVPSELPDGPDGSTLPSGGI